MMMTHRCKRPLCLGGHHPRVARSTKVDPRLVESGLLHQWKVDRHGFMALRCPEAGAVHYADNLHALTVWLSVILHFPSYSAALRKRPAREAIANDDDP